MFAKPLNRKKGFVAIITVVVLSAIMLVITLTISLASLGQLVSVFSFEQSSQALQIADTCAEEGYLRLKRDTAYAGGTISVSDGSCTVIVTGSGSTRTISVTATKGNYTRKITADVTLSTNVANTTKRTTLTNWQEP